MQQHLHESGRYEVAQSGKRSITTVTAPDIKISVVFLAC